MIPTQCIPNAYVRGKNLYLSTSKQVQAVKDYVNENLSKYHLEADKIKSGYRLSLWRFDRIKVNNQSQIHFKSRLKYLEEALNDIE